MSTHERVCLARRRWVMAAGTALTGAAFAPYQAALAGGAPKVLRLAVVPQFTPLEMTRFWTPVVDALAQHGIPCELMVYPSIAAFEPEFLKGKADLVFLNPYHMVMAYKMHGYVPLLHDARPLEGVLVVKNDGPVHSLEQLKDHRISFPAPNAFAASLYIRSVLDRQYRLPFETNYAGSHRNAVRQVLAGDSAAAGVIKTTLEKEAPDVRQNLRVVYTTPALPPHPLAVHPRVPVAVRQALVEVLAALAANADTQALMSAIQMPHPVLANYKQEYAVLEKLKIEKYVQVE